MGNRVTRIALDIDGTLAGYGGIIDQWTINEFLKTAHVGIVSTRADCHRVASDLGLGYACCAGIDKPSKADCLRDYASKFLVDGGSLYIADMPYDFEQASEANWNFADVNHLRLNLGAGGDVHRGYVNIDVRLLPGIDIVRDLEKDPIPFPDGTIQYIKMQDFLEHLSWRKVADFVKHVYAKLKSGGYVFIQSPDVDAIYHGVVEKRDFRGDFKYRFEAISYWLGGGQDYPENTHKAFFTIESIEELLRDVGFADVWCRNVGTNFQCTARKK
jgi:predicted SAM-dependent methyltransferase